MKKPFRNIAGVRVDKISLLEGETPAVPAAITRFSLLKMQKIPDHSGFSGYTDPTFIFSTMDTPTQQLRTEIKAIAEALTIEDRDGIITALEKMTAVIDEMEKNEKEKTEAANIEKSQKADSLAELVTMSQETARAIDQLNEEFRELKKARSRQNTDEPIEKKAGPLEELAKSLFFHS